MMKVHLGKVMFLTPEIWLDFRDPDSHRISKAYLVIYEEHSVVHS